VSKRVDEDFAVRLLEACRHAGVAYSQTAIADLIGENKQTVDHWMNKGTTPRPATLFTLAGKLGVDAQWLGTGAGKPPPRRPGTHHESVVVTNSTIHRSSGKKEQKIKKS
jgi:transcriptional regulator with XRE-family HTH domain